MVSVALTVARRQQSELDVAGDAPQGIRCFVFDVSEGVWVLPSEFEGAFYHVVVRGNQFMRWGRIFTYDRVDSSITPRGLLSGLSFVSCSRSRCHFRLYTG